MAETLGVAGSIVGIASLAGQICTGIQQLYAFVDSVKHGASDFQNIKNDILLIERVVRRMSEDYTDLPEHFDIGLLESSFELCLSRVDRVLAMIQSLDTLGQKNRTLQLIKSTVKKIRVAEFMKELDSAKMTLMLVYQHHIQEGDLRNVQRLFRKGLASPFDVTPDGDTALHFAAFSGNPELVAFLLYNGADANVENTSGENALHLAMISPREEEHLQLARLLVERGQVDPIGSAPEFGIVHSYAGPVEAFRYLIHQDEFFVDLEERNRSGRTILQHQIFHRLYYGDSFKRIQILFDAGHHLPGDHIDGDPIYDGYTALHCAVHIWANAKLREDDHTAQQSGRGYTMLTAIGEMIHFSSKKAELHQGVLTAWLNLLSEAGYDVKAYCSVETVLERRRRLETSNAGFHVIVEEMDGMEGVDGHRISIASLETVIELEDDVEEHPKIESTQASSSALTRGFHERPAGVIFADLLVSSGLTKKTFVFVMLILFLYCFFFANMIPA
ncbi:hypothetical protein CDV55_107918 [Aspergillus turcosus]|uniref:Uncharacterized protein n=1 Tax=Aspergillus turcosus TaxID=1245748 RepID=A0A397I257_9EURO|nr:hypothetical protein CDV55_107918 [Aspergillus turcosus]RLL97645.1 hypothetical protein CFD26_100484 [Aspergillus turcosus]